MHALGTTVKYHHRAAVARYQDEHWRLLEGVSKNEYTPGFEFDRTRDLFRDRPRQESVNKTIMVWPEEGSGVVIGLVRRGIGKSVAGSYTSSSYYGEAEFDPGWFEAHSWHRLYAIKWDLNGVEYILAPEWAVSLT